jgi:hypothetical protein
MAKESRWDLALGLAGVAYLGIVLFVGIDLPVVGVSLVVLAVYALIRGHRGTIGHR